MFLHWIKFACAGSASMLVVSMVHATSAAKALPVLDHIAYGQATLSRNTANGRLTLNQTSTRLIANWNSFNVGQQAVVTFNQPNASSIVLNRVNSAAPAEIFGQVTANGRLLLVSPSGLLFGPNSQVSAASVVASLLNIADRDFKLGKLVFSQESFKTSGWLLDNQGSIQAQNGNVLLLAPLIKNSGTLATQNGNVILANASQLGLTDDYVMLNKPLDQPGLIQYTGVIHASRIEADKGKVYLVGDRQHLDSQVSLAGQIAAAGTLVKGKIIHIDAALNTIGNIQLDALTGIHVGAAFTASGNNVLLSLNSAEGLILTSVGQISLPGLKPRFRLNNQYYGVIQSIEGLQAMGQDASSLSGRYVLGGDLDASATGQWNNGQGFAPVGNATTPFSGVFDGLGHVINGLVIQRAWEDYIGLFGVARNSVLQNIGLTGSNIKGTYWVGGLVGEHIADGAVASIKNSFNRGDIKAMGNVGGLVGYNLALNGGTASIDSSYASGSVLTAQQYYGNALGGLVGTNAADNGTASIQNSYANSRVEGGYNLGGLVGWNIASAGVASIKNSYATGSVKGGDNAGGLLGAHSALSQTSNGATALALLENSYANNQVQGAYYRGSVVGLMGSGGGTQVKQVYWNSDLSGSYSFGNNPFYPGSGSVGATVEDVHALNNTTIKNKASFAAWGSDVSALGSTGSIWRIYEGDTAPLLRSFLRPLTIKINDDSKVYDGVAYSGASPLNFDALDWFQKGLRGTSTAGGTAQGAENVGQYGIGLKAYSEQDVYDFTTQSMHAGYDVSVQEGTLTINKAPLLIQANAASKAYDGKAGSSVKPSVTGLMQGDRITGLVQQYSDPAVGEDKRLSIRAGYVIHDANNGANYSVQEQDSQQGVIY